MINANTDTNEVDPSNQTNIKGSESDQESHSELVLKKSGNTTVKEYQIILNWMEVGDNFKWIIGRQGEKKRVISGAQLDKKSAFRNLREYMVQELKLHDEDAQNYTVKHVSNIVTVYLQKYKKTRANVYQTGSGLTERDFQQSLQELIQHKKLHSDLLNKMTKRDLTSSVTLEDKINKLCYGFRRLEKLYGDYPGILPPYTKCSLDSGIIANSQGYQLNYYGGFDSMAETTQNNTETDTLSSTALVEQKPNKSPERKRRKTQETLLSFQDQYLRLSQERAATEKIKWEKELQLREQEIKLREKEVASKLENENRKLENEKLQILLDSNLFDKDELKKLIQGTFSIEQ
ncbi:hypothetical protein HK103_007445 [Boothiomyces macroporosus]|uniref:Uncharacterized protein n=1 Tax=Boothiomyces macroporosus TaxID=261099 RepID=A0AAD5UD15_9FUNG|nr:hypothetical protein HK103_007445 [Boothiomyces macroporosus]